MKTLFSFKMVDFKNLNIYFLKQSQCAGKKIRIVEEWVPRSWTQKGAKPADVFKKCPGNNVGWARRHGAAMQVVGQPGYLGLVYPSKWSGAVLLPSPATIGHQRDMGLPGGQHRMDSSGCLPLAPPAAGAAGGHWQGLGQHLTVPTLGNLKADYSESVYCRVLFF